MTNAGFSKHEYAYHLAHQRRRGGDRGNSNRVVDRGRVPSATEFRSEAQVGLDRGTGTVTEDQRPRSKNAVGTVVHYPSLTVCAP